MVQAIDLYAPSPHRTASPRPSVARARRSPEVFAFMHPIRACAAIRRLEALEPLAVTLNRAARGPGRGARGPRGFPYASQRSKNTRPPGHKALKILTSAAVDPLIVYRRLAK